METWFVCPMPQEWARIHRRLLQAWRRSEGRFPEPPRPLILNGWVATDDWEKAHRWAETIEWVKRWQLDHLVPDIPEGRRYYTTDERAQRSREALWDEIKELGQRYPDGD